MTIPKIHQWGMTTVYQGDVRDCLAAMHAESVHCCVTSPPYWALRSYLTKDSPLKRFELGSEPTPQEYIANLVGVFAAVRRVLRDDAVLWVNLGDSYNARPGQRQVEDEAGSKQKSNTASILMPSRSVPDLKPLDRVGIPERFALAMQADGWYWRDSIIWSKLAPMPSSVNGWRWERHRVKRHASRRARDKKGADNGQKPHGDRDGKAFASSAVWSDCPGCHKCEKHGGYVLRRGSWRTTCAHEVILMFAKTDDYFCDAQAVAEPAEAATIARNQYSRIVDDPDEQYAVAHDHEFDGSTRNPRSVWEIGPDPFKGKHYACFPRELPERCIRASTSVKGCCPKCGAQLARVVARSVSFNSGSGRAGNPPEGKNDGGAQTTSGDYDIRTGPVVDTRTTGFRPTCDCGEHPPVPSTVLDCFGGSGTTAEVAMSMGHRAILCELNPDYIEIMRERLNNAVPLLCAIGGAA